MPIKNKKYIYQRDLQDYANDNVYSWWQDHRLSRSNLKNGGISNKSSRSKKSWLPFLRQKSSLLTLTHALSAISHGSR